MGIQDVIALSIAGTAAFFAVRTVWRTIHRGGCGGSCGRSKTTSCKPDENRTPDSPRLVRKPLVTVEEIGVPRPE